MRGSSQQGLQHSFDRLSALKRFMYDVSMALRRPRQCFLQVSGDILQQVEMLSTLGWYLRVTKVGTKGLIHGLTDW